MTAQEREPLDPAKVMAEHCVLHDECAECSCAACGYHHPCEPYRLAEALAARTETTEKLANDLGEAHSDRDRLAAENAALREQVQRVRDFADGYREGNLIRAALAGEGAADQPHWCCDAPHHPHYGQVKR